MVEYDLQEIEKEKFPQQFPVKLATIENTKTAKFDET